ncbi:MAG: hypothetical protein ACRD3W_04285, partial [Terriglobales bacterium]
MQLNRLELVATAAIALLLVSIPASYSQKGWGNKTWNPKGATAIPATMLRTAPALPDVSEYTGQTRFTDGMCQTDGSGQGYYLNWQVKDDRPTVLAWYKAA